MKAFLKKLILFTLVLVPIYILAVCAWGLITPLVLRPNLPYLKGAYGHLSSRISDLKNFSDVDMLVLGSSRAYRGLDPRIFSESGIRMFNLGSTAQSPVQSLVLAKQYLRQLNPELVIIEVSPEIMSTDGLESGLDLLANNTVDFHAAEMTLKVNHVKLYNTLIYAVFRQLLHLDDNYSEPVRIREDSYVSGGYVERKMSRYNPPDSMMTQVRRLLPLQKKALSELVAFINMSGSRVVLVEVPSTTVRYRSHANHDEFSSFVSSLGSFEDFNSRILLNDSVHFYDASHLNQEGVALFNKALIDWLEKSGNLDFKYSE